jgi:hypothetical protein
MARKPAASTLTMAFEEPKRVKGLSEEQIALMEQECTRPVGAALRMS